MKHLEEKVWYRFLKVIYIAAWIVGIGFISLLSYADENLGLFLIGVFILGILLVVLRDVFFYIAFGKK